MLVLIFFIASNCADDVDDDDRMKGNRSAFLMWRPPTRADTETETKTKHLMEIINFSLPCLPELTQAA